MSRSLGVLSLFVVLLAAACGSEKKSEEGKAEQECGAAPAAMAGQPTLPAKFPTPDKVTYTGQKKTGPLGGNFITVEAAGYLIPLLDRKKDAAEIQTLTDRVGQRALERAATSAFVTSAPEAFGNICDIDFSLAAKAHPVAAVG